MNFRFVESIKYKRSKCIACGICSTDAPLIFELDNSDGKANLLDAELKKDYYFRMLWPDEKNQMEQIVNMCSVQAIQII
ncbi:MAG: ferredoxin [Salinivirgaceae bacterium]|jgi:ferredoxin|nr:ferredoxin [Salinivirgaceae bacterium]